MTCWRISAFREKGLSMESGADDIRADFLVEAGELVEGLSAQLIELEARPADSGLLNAIFRAFHTVKGGAGFLDLPPLVAVCHAAEDVFNALRGNRITVDATLMDVVLQVVDLVQQQMQALADGRALPHAPGSLIEGLHAVAKGESPAADVVATAVPEAPTLAQTLLASGDGDAISDDDFEALLDQLHGKGAPTAIAVPVAAPPPAPPPPPVAVAPADPVAAPAANSKLAAAEPTVRVDTARLDGLMNLVGELVLVRNRLKALRGDRQAAPGVAQAIGELDFLTRSLQNSVMQIRMQPIGRVLSRFPRIARDVARGLGKQVQVVLVGEQTELDKNLVEALADPLVHMVRNSVDHGIEMPDVRQRCGKAPVGELIIKAEQQGDGIVITVRDDGAGIDPERVRQKCVEKGLISAGDAARMSQEECLQMVFLPGFSTKEQVSDLSGRGVGMDVVMSAIKVLGGSVHIDSRLGHGCCVTLRLPLTLAILSALIVDADGRRYALPLAPVRDIFALDPARVTPLERWDAVLMRNETLRLVYLEPPGERTDGAQHHVVVAQVGESRYGFVVRAVRGREEVVIKPLGPSLRGLAGVTGATVMPDGRLALILDFTGLVVGDPRNRMSRPETQHG